MGNKVLNTNISLLVSFVSGVSFLAILAFVPTRPLGEKDKFDFIEKLYENKIEPIQYTDKEKKKDKEIYYEINSKKLVLPEVKETIFYSGITKESKDVFTNNEKTIQNYNFQSNTYFKNDKLALSSTHESRVSNQVLEYIFQNKLTDSQIFSNRNQTLNNIEMSYKLNSSFSANVKSTQFDIFDDRLKQNATTMAGITYVANKLFSTGVIGGDSSFNNSSIRYANQTYLNGNQFYKDTDNLNRDLEKNQRTIFEWNTNITPTKNIVVQTAVYNSNKAFINETNSSEGARLALGYNLKYFMLNLKYNFLSDNLMRAVTRPDLPVVNNRDFAAVGFSFHLDSSKRYMVYLGNNYHNVATPKTADSNIVPSQTSFSASIRGKSSEGTFFLNFRNNQNREFFYSNFGVFRIPTSSQVNLDYATSVGMELNF